MRPGGRCAALSWSAATANRTWPLSSPGSGPGGGRPGPGPCTSRPGSCRCSGTGRHRLRRRPPSWRTRQARPSRRCRRVHRNCARCCASRGVFIGRGPAPKIAFLYTGQGSQYVNMLRELRGHEPIVAADVRRGRRGHDAAARQAADCVHLRRRRRPGGSGAGRAAVAADRDHPAGRARRRPRAHPPARPRTASSPTGDGPQPRRVRCAGRGRRPVVRGGARGGQRPRPRDGEPRRATTTGRWRP